MTYQFKPANSDVSESAGAMSDMLSKNALTTAGVLIGAGTGVAGAGILFMALPGQMAVAASLTGGLIYAGNRQANGLPIVPGTGSDKSKPAEATATPVAA